MNAVGDQALRLGQQANRDLRDGQPDIDCELTQVLREAAAARSAGLCSASSGSSANWLNFMGTGAPFAPSCMPSVECKARHDSSHVFVDHRAGRPRFAGVPAESVGDPQEGINTTGANAAPTAPMNSLTKIRKELSMTEWLS